MDLSGQSTIIHSWDVDPDTGLVTVTFMNARMSVLGTLILEQSRFRSMLKALNEVAQFYLPDGTPSLVDARTTFNSETTEASTVFD